jgi:DNA-directed RNA polymerase subunit RPC12/RpoP
MEFEPTTTAPLVQVERLVKCPKCGGGNGYHFFRVVRQQWYGKWAGEELATWDSKEEFIDDDGISESKTATCIDCGKRISRKLIGT